MTMCHFILYEILTIFYPDEEAPSKPREETNEFLHGVVPAEEEEDHRSQSRLP